jgi:type IV secretory pathway VirB9-like protein
MRRIVRSGTVTAACVLLAACATPPQHPPSGLTAAKPVDSLPVRDAAIDQPAAPGNRNPIPDEEARPAVESFRTAIEATAEANRASTRMATADRFHNARLVYDWHDGEAYDVFVPAGDSVELVFDPGEVVLDWGYSDKVNFHVEDSQRGTPNARTPNAKERDVLVVSGLESGHKTRLFVLTSERDYFYNLKTQRVGNWSVYVRPPADAPKPARPRVPLTIAHGAALENLDCRYRLNGTIKTGMVPLKAEDIQVCTDGSQTLIRFPSIQTSGGQTVKPVPFTDGPVNYAPMPDGAGYLLDTPVQIGELRYGDEAIGIRRARQ